jgi:NAD(P)-dependent dehydrogenase (short-subunit alcohol dehydrogenase family)
MRMRVLNPFKLDRRVAPITGAGGGLGRAYATALAEAVAAAACVDLDLAVAEETALLVRAAGCGAGAIAAKIAGEVAIVDACAETARELGSMEIAFANAGVAESRHPLIGAPLSEWQRVLDINPPGVFLTVREAARVMVPRRYQSNSA